MTETPGLGVDNLPNMVLTHGMEATTTPTKTAADLVVGDRIRHEQIGTGTVTDIAVHPIGCLDVTVVPDPVDQERLAITTDFDGRPVHWPLTIAGLILEPGDEIEMVV